MNAVDLIESFSEFKEMKNIDRGTMMRIVEDVFKENPGYNAWIQNADFPLYTKKILKAIKERMSIPKKGMSDAEKLNALQQKFNLR